MMHWKEKKKASIVIMTALLFMLSMLFAGLPVYAGAAELTLTPVFLVSTEITKQGDINLTFNKAIADPEGAQDGFSVTVNGSDVAVNKVEGNKSTAAKIKLVLAEKVSSGEDKVIITYTSDGSLKSADGVAVESFTARMGATAPALTADTTDNLAGQAIKITFAPDADWTQNICGVTVRGVSVAGQYTVGDGVITIAGEVFSLPGEYYIVVQAEGYSDAAVTQNISTGQEPAASLVVFQKPYASATGVTLGVGIEGEFKVSFTEPIVPGSLTISLNKTGTLKTPEQEKKSIDFTYELAANSTLKIKTNATLDYGTYYEMVIASGLKGISGTITEADAKMQFCTVAFNEPACKITRDGQEVSKVALGQTYQLVATLENCSDEKQTVDAVLQLRGGKGARNMYGGNIIIQSVQTIEIKKGSSKDITLDFTVPQDLDSIYVYGDVFVWEKAGSSASGMPFHFSCLVE